MKGAIMFWAGLLLFVTMIAVARSDKTGETVSNRSLALICGCSVLLSFLLMVAGIIMSIWEI